MEKKRPDINQIHKIIKRGDLNLLHFCLYGETEPGKSKPRGINLKDRRGMSPLLVAVEQENLPIVEFLIKAGCNLNAKDKISRTGLHIAAAQGHILIAESLISHGLSKTAKDKVCSINNIIIFGDSI